MRTDTWARLPGSYHGSGCTLASAIAAMLANGLDIPEAVREAQDYTWHALKKAYRPGMGQFLPDRLFWAREDDAAPGDDADARARLRCPEPALTTRRSRRRERARRLAGLYAVTPDLADTADLVARVEAALDGGAMRHPVPQQDRRRRAEASAGRSAGSRHRGAAARSSSSTTMPALCADVDADGVHLGEDDGEHRRRAATSWARSASSARPATTISRAPKPRSPPARTTSRSAASFPSRVKPDARRADVALLAPRRRARRARRRHRRHHRAQRGRARARRRACASP